MGLKDRLAGTPVLGTALAVQERYKRDAGDQLAGAIAFFGFLSLVPLLLLAVAAAGFVLSDPRDQVRVALLLTEALPGFDAAVAAGEADAGVAAMVATVVERRGTIGLVGAITLLVTGMKVVASAMTATRVVFRGEVLTGIGARVRQLLAMVGLGTLALAAVAASSLAAADLEALPRAASFPLGLAASFLLDLGLFVAAYALLSPTSALTVRQLVPGATFAAAGWTLLQIVGATFVARQAAGANALYGALGGVVALLLLLYLAGRLYLYGAELSAVLVERLHGPLDDGGAAATPDTAGGAGATSPSPTSTATEAGPSLVPAAAVAEGAPGQRGNLRTTAAFVLAAAALAAAWRVLGPSRDR